jgi:hypothetical protein
LLETALESEVGGHPVPLPEIITDQWLEARPAEGTAGTTGAPHSEATTDQWFEAWLSEDSIGATNPQ